MAVLHSVVWVSGFAQISQARRLERPVVEVSTAWSATAAHPGERITLAVVMDIHQNWHVNPNRPEDPFLIPTTVELIDPPLSLLASTPLYPKSHRIAFGQEGQKKMVPVYSGKAIIYVPMALVETAEIGELSFKLKVRWQACDDRVCLRPTDVTRSVELTVADTSVAVQPTNVDLFKNLQVGGEQLNIPFFGLDFTINPNQLWLLLPIALLGGFLLNLTPCVLPVIPIKIMNLSNTAGNRHRCFMLGSSMSGGVVGFWLALGTTISAVSGFSAANQLFQYPTFTIGVGLIIAAMAGGMCGLFVINLPQWVYRINPRQDSIMGSFGFGIMTAVLSTPCTAPFMGAAAAWAATQHPAITLSTFAAIGAGMALPYLVLSLSPALVSRMPRTGPASVLIKQVMGILMLAAAGYFIGAGLSGILASPPDPPSRFYWWIVTLFVAVAGCWLIYKSLRITSSQVKRVLFVSLGVLFVITSVYGGLHLTGPGPISWVYYTPERLNQAHAERKIVLLEFTAEWCLNCHVLEQTVLHNSRIVDLVNQQDIVPIKVDITGNNEMGNKKLLEVGSRTIPLLIVYDSDAREVFRSDAYTVQQLFDVITKTRQQTASEQNTP